MDTFGLMNGRLHLSEVSPECMIRVEKEGQHRITLNIA